MALGGVASLRASSAAWLPLVCLHALLCLRAAAQPEGQQRPPAGERPSPGKEGPPQGQRPPPGEGPMPAWVFMVNIDHEKPMDLYWIGQQRQRQQFLEPGRLTRITTFVGHNFEVTDQNAEQNPNAAAPARIEIKVLDDNLIKLWFCERKGEEARASIVCSPRDLEYKGGMWDQHVDLMKKSCNDLLLKHPEDSAFFCNRDYTQWVVAQCAFDTAPEEFEHVYAQQSKLARQEVEADHSHVKRFTKTGHRVDKIPAQLFKDLWKHWSENRLKLPRPENNRRFSPVLAGCKSDTWMLRMTETAPTLRQQVIDTLQPLVAKWAGLKTDDIEFTVLYGMRMYRHGNSFPFHRDIVHTHVLSAILEIGQLELDHPDPSYTGNESWPLQIYDHSGEIHTHEYKPGQMIFYESFTCPHGRPTPFKGREIASMFVHFRPKGWGPQDWDKDTILKNEKKGEEL